MLLQSQIYTFWTFGGGSVVRLYILLNIIIIVLNTTNEDIFEFLIYPVTYLLSSNFIPSVNVISIPLIFSRLWFCKMLDTPECSNQIGVITLCEGLYQWLVSSTVIAFNQWFHIFPWPRMCQTLIQAIECHAYYTICSVSLSSIFTKNKIK